MASVFHVRARLEIAQQACDLEAAAGSVAGASGTVKLMLLKAAYTPDGVNHDLVDGGGANDPLDHEADCTGYTGGYGGAGRTTVSGAGLNPAWTRDDPNSRIEYDFDDTTWSALGNGANNTLGYVATIVEDFVGTAGNDTESLVIGVDDPADVTTNGGDITYSPNAEGVLQL